MSRQEIINNVIKDLTDLKSKNPNYTKSLEISIEFFYAIRSFYSYIKWLIRTAPTINPSEIMELTDYPLEKWSTLMHKDLIEIEKKRFPGLIVPIVNELFTTVQNKDFTKLIDVGSGGMELEKQLIEKLNRFRYKGKLIIVGVERSNDAIDMAFKNLRGLNILISLHFTDKLTRSFIDDIIKADQNQYVIIIGKNNLYTLAPEFSGCFFDIFYHSLFRHHLNSGQKKDIDLLSTTISKRVIEYDGYKNFFQLIPQSIIAWRKPILLDGSILSALRYDKKNDIIKIAKATKGKLFFTRIGSYLLSRDSSIIK